MVSLKNSSALFMVIAIALAAGCSRENPCARLQKEMATPGFEPTDAAYCARELKRLSVVSQPFGSIQIWKKEVQHPSEQLLIDVMLAVVERAKDLNSQLVTFGRYPDSLPRPNGLSLSADDWSAGPLGRLGLQRPQKIYCGIQVKEVAEKSKPGLPYVRFEMFHDFDGDGTIGSTAIEGTIRRGRSFFQGGFVRADSSSVGLIGE